MLLVTRKGVYHFEYTDSWEKLNENQLPPIDCFYMSFNVSHVDDEDSHVDYEHASKVWVNFNM